MAGKKYPIRMDLRDIERRTAERDAARRRAERQRQDMGSMEDILGRAERNQAREANEEREMRRSRRSRRNGNAKGGKVKMAYGGKTRKMAKGGSVSKRADGCCSKGKTRGRMC